MIIHLRENLESTTGVPFHFVTITEEEARPCGTVSKTSVEHSQALQKPSGFRVSGIAVEIFADDYEEMDELCEKLVDTYNGKFVELVERGGKVKLYVDDEEDESYPGEDGSDDWIYSRVITFRVHHKKVDK